MTRSSSSVRAAFSSKFLHIYSDDVRFWLPRSPKAPRIQTSWLLGIGENQQNVQTQTVRSNDFPWLQRFNNCGSCPEKIFNSHKRMERIRNRCVEHLRSYTMSQSLRTTLYHFIFNTCRFPDGTWEPPRRSRCYSRTLIAEMTAQPLRTLLPFTTNNQQLKLLHSCFTVSFQTPEK